VRDGRLVYSTESGDRRGAADEELAAQQPPGDGVVRVFREKGGRGGKVVTVVRGLEAAVLQETARELKRLCGSGGAIKDGAIEIQGDHREKVAARLGAQGHRVKLAGG
jgi:translation initiation factor 1